MTQKIREGCDFGFSRLEGEVEVDESYFGGKESNKNVKQRIGPIRVALG